MIAYLDCLMKRAGYDCTGAPYPKRPLTRAQWAKNEEKLWKLHLELEGRQTLRWAADTLIERAGEIYVRHFTEAELVSGYLAVPNADD